MEDESVWWFGAYLAMPMNFAALMFWMLRTFLMEAEEAAGPEFTDATTGSSFSLGPVPSEIQTAVEIMFFASLAYAVLGMATSLFLDSRWVSSRQADWRPTPWIYSAAGLIPGVSSLVALYYLMRRYEAVGIAGINAESVLSPRDVRESRWWVVLLGSAAATQISVTPSLFIHLVGITPDSVVYLFTILFLATAALTVFIATAVIALVIDAKRIEASSIGWKPWTPVYAVLLFFLPVLALPISLTYLYRRRKKVGF